MRREDAERSRDMNDVLRTLCINTPTSANGHVDSAVKIAYFDNRTLMLFYVRPWLIFSPL